MDMELSRSGNAEPGLPASHSEHANSHRPFPLDIPPKSAVASRGETAPPSAKSLHPLETRPLSPSPLGRLFAFSPRPRISHSWPDIPPLATEASVLKDHRSLYARIKPWTLAVLWIATTLGFLIAIAFWRKEVFTGLDNLAKWLRGRGFLGYFLLFCMILITTIPPLPLYSTFIVLAGYCYGTWIGAVISYIAALTGAVSVFLISRTFFPGAVARTISASPTFKRIIRVIEKRPRLLFLIRLAPYPYNMMNVLLSSSRVLTFQTYTLCTALSLFKCVIYTAVGGSIHSFADYQLHAHDSKHSHNPQQRLARIWGVIGIALCIGIMVYLTYLARKAVDEFDDEDGDELVNSMELGLEETRPFMYASPTAVSSLDIIEARTGSAVLPEQADISHRHRISLSREIDGPPLHAVELVITVEDYSHETSA